MRGAYLLLLLGSVAGVALVDRRWTRVAWDSPGRTTGVVAGGAAAFLLWDTVAIAHGFYGRGGGPALLGVEVAPHVPVEEVAFVVLLCYLALVVHAGATRLLARPR